MLDSKKKSFVQENTHTIYLNIYEKAFFGMLRQQEMIKLLTNQVLMN